MMGRSFLALTPCGRPTWRQSGDSRAVEASLEPAPAGHSTASWSQQTKNGLSLDFIVASSGALVLSRGRVLESHPLGNQVLRRLLEGFPEVATGIQTSTRFAVNFGPTSPNQTRVESFDIPLGEVAYAMSLNFGGEEAAAAGVGTIRKEFGGDLQAFQNVGSVDVVARGCSKGHGLEVVRENLGPDVLAGIGDSCNDVSLLDAADIAYTFEASPEEVCKHADRLVGSVAEALEDVALGS